MLRLSPDGLELADLLPAVGRMLGITGSPGAGKSMLAALLALRHGATVVPMDGFHLADIELERRGLRDRKGAPETFDAPGYAALLRRVRDREDLVLAPTFERELEQPVAGALPVPGDAELVVTEGNYLLLPEQPWPRVRAQLDDVWHVVVDDGLRLERLVARHVRFGKTPDEARAWVERVDQPNALRVEAAAGRADLVLDLTDLAVSPAGG
ncbi:MAG: coaA 1 [Nocardioides sp.]|nr:coaA 1 [Nocardioides sp.]